VNEVTLDIRDLVEEMTESNMLLFCRRKLQNKIEMCANLEHDSYKLESTFNFPLNWF